MTRPNGRHPVRKLRPVVWALLAIVIGVASPTRGWCQVTPGTNVNMVSGTRFPDGDPFLQRQNEPTVAASTRNPLHLLAGANDYRTVDLPGPFDPLRGERMNADAWVGLFKSFDGGRTWRSTLLPGYPQDISAEGLASPLKGRQAGTDPVVRAGTNGLFYYAGLAFDRGQNAPSRIFVARFIDRNDREEGDSIAYLGTRVVDADVGTRFLDKPALAVDIPRSIATCTIDAPTEDGPPATQVIPAGPVYVAYSAFTGTGAQERSQILFARSTDCGMTWSTPRSLSALNSLNQNAQIAVDPATGAVYVSWRLFQIEGRRKGAGLLVVKSVDGGVTFGNPVVVGAIAPFDQGTTATSFRTNSFQTMAVDSAGRVYIAWPERGFATLRPDRVTGDSRIVVSTSATGGGWTQRRAIETGGLGHHIMPAMTFHGGKLRLLYYGLREDVSQLFGPYVDEAPILAAPDPKPPRHTIDVYIAQAEPGPNPQFVITRLSDYAFGSLEPGAPIQQLQYNPPNLTLFRQGTVPFLGDYIDLAPAPMFVKGSDGSWIYNMASTESPISHGVWADNRDVRAPADGNWTNYTPVVSDSLGTQSLFDPTLPVPPCAVGQTGMRNQNIYTAKVTEGLFVGSPGNTKPLGLIQRAFVVLVENASNLVRSYRLTIIDQPPGGEASFTQFPATEGLLTQLDASVPPLSTVARSVYITSSDPEARVQIAVTEIAEPGSGPLPDGLSGLVVLNSDSTNPRIQNPRIQNPRIQNPDILAAEAYNPAFTTAIFATSIPSPRIQNPTVQDPSILDSSVQAPRLQNDAIANPGIIDASVQAPRIQNTSIQDPAIQNPRIQNSDLVNGAIQDTTWILTNDGNTTATYAVKLVSNGTVPDGIATQLVLHKTYQTPGADDCTLALQPRMVVVANIPDPEFTDPSELTNPRIQNPRIQNATLSLAPGESANVTIRVVDPNRFDATMFDAGAAITPAAVAHSVNTEDVAQGITVPRVAVPLTITSAQAGSGAPGAFYSQTLQTFGASGGTTWSISGGTLPPGLSLDPLTGTISGTPTTPGNYVFTVQSLDAAGNIDTQTLSVAIDPPLPSGFSRLWNGADADWTNPINWSPRGVPTSVDSVYISAAALVMPRLTSNITVVDLVVEPGATLDTNGFTATITGNVEGNSIIGAGTVSLTGIGVTASGTFPSLTIAGAVTAVGPLTATGRLSLSSGARLDLNGIAVAAMQELVTNSPTGIAPLIVSGGTSLTVGGVNVNGLTLDRVLLTIEGGLLIRFSNVRFLNYAPEDVQLTINHPGLATTFAMDGLAYFVTPTTGRYIQANDTAGDSQILVIEISASLPADGSSRSATAGGAVVNWLSNPADASIAVAQWASPSPAIAGSPLTYTILVANGGPAAATNVVLTDTLPAGVTFVSAAAEQGSCEVAGSTVTCSLGAFPAGGTVIVTIVVVPPLGASLSNSAAATASESDPTSADNAHTISTPVAQPADAADLSITMADSADPVSPGTPFTYTLAVNNSGPAAATGVAVTDVLPAALTASTATSTHGSCTIVGQVVTCVVGALATGEQAFVTVTVTASGSGLVTNSASVVGAQVDPNAANNSATEPTMVVSTGGCQAPSFSGPQLLQAGGTSVEIISGDLNGDGDVDFVAPVQDSNAVAVFLGNGSGGFGAGTLVPVGTGPVEGALADFNNDQKLDLALEGLNDAYVALGDGTGGFGAPATFSFTPGIVTDVRSGHFNTDGRPDLAIIVDTPNALHVLLNDGAGGFAPLPTIPLQAQPARVAVGDFNGDNRADLAVSYFSPVGTTIPDVVSVLLGDGTGGFAAPTTVSLLQTSRSHVYSAGNLNTDGHADLAVVEFDGTTRRVFLLFGDGTGQFTPQLLANAPAAANGLTSGDVNGDGFLDLVVSAGHSVGVQLGDGTGAFAAPILFVAPAARDPHLADFTGDGRIDLAVPGSAGVSVLLNACGQAPTDVALSVVDSADPVTEGSPVTYTVTVTNPGSAVASNLTTTAVISSGASLTSINGGGASCTTSGTVSTCSLASLAPNDSVGMQFVYATAAAGTLTFTAGVTADGADTNPSDNTDIETTVVTAAGVDLVVDNTDDSGSGSLRQAILDSNADAGDTDRIVFAIPGGGVHTITLLSSLPTLTQPVVIDATTQPGFSGTPLVELNGNGGAGNGLTVTGGSSTIRGLAINRFSGSGISITTNGGNVVEGNYVGTDPTGTIARANGNGGISVSNSAGNRIGGTVASSGNLVSGNTGSGILISGSGATANDVQGNLVGTNAAGTAALPNSIAGVQVIGGSNNTIGGPTPAHRNLISGSANHGVFLRDGASTNLVQGNFIGTNLAGSGAVGNAASGVLIRESSTNTITDNVISGNNAGVQVLVQNAPNIATANVVRGNRIGTNAAGTAAVANTRGVLIVQGATANTVGGTSVSDRNIISGNLNGGVLILDASTTGNQVTGNYIGVNAAGTAVLGNGEDGVFISGAGNTIGGTVPGAGNVISGNRYGVGIAGAGATGNVLKGNLIGTDPGGAFGTTAFGNLTHGLNIFDGASGNTVGGLTAAESNVIGGNVENGMLLLSGAHDNLVQNNVIAANGHNGIVIRDAPNNTIGDPGNVISGNSHAGMYINGAGATGNLIQGNRIGTDAAGTGAFANARGINIDDAPNNIIGGTTPQARNLISGNAVEGILIVGIGSSGSVIRGNYIGVDVTGSVAIPNQFHGLAISDASGTIVGGVVAGAGNVISGNGVNGVGIFGATSTQNVIEGNRIGTNAAGTAAIANALDGVGIVDGSNNRVGGTTAAARNLVSGNGRVGIGIFESAATNNVVSGNFVGTDVTGASAVPNLGIQSGIFVLNSPGNTIGGTVAGAGNVVSGNAVHAVTIVGESAVGNLVQGNFIGTDASGLSQLANGGIGLDIVSAPNTMVGGPGSARNVISGNGLGIQIRTGATGNQLRGNLIGTDRNGTAPIPNGNGVYIDDASGNTIGGDGNGNVIAFNGGTGINIVSATSTSNAILGNSIVGNGGLGIDLDGDGITPHDVGDPDSGPNNRQNFPVITSAVASGGGTTVQGTLNSTPNTTFRLEFFTSPACDPSGNGEGQAFLGSLTVATDAAGDTGFSAVVGSATGALTATATDPGANTSEFSACQAVIVSPGTFLVTNTNDSGSGSLRQAILDSNASIGVRETIGFSIGGAAPHTIAPLSPLPTITDPVTIDGTTAPDFAGTPVIELDGTNAGGNASGLFVTAGNTVVRGLVINRFGTGGSGDGGAGIVLQSAGGNVIEGSFIGTDVDGATARPNRSDAIWIDGPGNRIGGTSAAARNVISGNGRIGVAIFTSAATGNLIHGNYIGVDSSGTARLDNTFEGVTIGNASGTRIGGINPGEGNVIAGNTTAGVQIFANDGEVASNNEIKGNFIGTNASLATGLGNGFDGVVIVADPGGTAVANSIGGIEPGAANVIAFNQVGGVTVRLAGATGNPILSNSIFSNGWLGIDASAVFDPDDVTANDAGDTDSGGNNLQNFPVITSAVTSGGVTTAQGTLNSTPGTTFRLEFFSNAACDSSGNGEGQTFVGSTMVTTDGAGNGSFSAAVAPATVVTATATDPDNNTSEFSACFVATGGDVPPTANAGVDQSVTAGSTVQLDGGGSSDPENAGLTYLWSVVSKPAGSAAVLSDATSATPTFVADLAGAYVVQLVVNDGTSDSPLDEVVITALPNNIGLALVDTPLVGLGGTATLQITLPVEAPLGGVVVTVTSDDANVVTVGPPNTASVEGGGTSAQVVLHGVSVGTTTVRATAPGYSDGALSVTVTPNVLTVLATLNVPFSQTTSFPINIPEPAPVGGIVVTLVSSAPGVIEVVTPTVTIPQGAVSVNGTVRGLTIGMGVVTATSPGFSSAASQVSSTGALNIVQTSVTFRPAFPTTITIRLESGGVPVAAPAPGVTVSLVAVDTTCLSVPPTATIPTGLVSVDVQLNYGGTAALPCTTTLTASSTILTQASRQVTVNPNAGITLQGLPVAVGAGLQTNFNPLCCQIAVVLGESQHGGVTVHIESSNPAVAVVSADATTAGTAAIDIEVPDGQTSVPYYVHGVEGASDTVTLTVSAPGFDESTGTVTVVQPALAIVNLPPSTTSLSANSDFYVFVGLPASGNDFLASVMEVRAGHSLTATLTSSAPAVGLLQTTQPGSPAQTRQVTIAAGFYYSPSGVAAGGVAFDPIGAGTTTVSATIPGFIATTAASQAVEVSGAGIALPGLPVTVGAGLQTSFNPFCCAIAAILGGAQHGGVTVHIESSNPAVAVVSPDSTTAGTAAIDIVVPDGQTYVPYYVQGVEGASGTVTLTFSAPGFGEAMGEVTIAQPALQIVSLPASTTSLSANTDFYLYVGLPASGNGFLASLMEVRAGHSLTATLTSSDPGVGLLQTTEPGSPAQTRQVTIAAGFYYSPSGVAAGGVAFDPIGAGTTTVSASIPGFIATTAASQAVEVSGAGIVMQGLPITVGAGLQTNFNPACCQIAVVLGGSQHGGVTVHIVSSDPAVALVSPDATTAGTAAIDIEVPDGQTAALYYVQGVEGATGPVTITASAPGFGEHTGIVTVEQPALQLVNLPPSTTSLSANSDFFLYVGLPASGNGFLATVMEVRAGQSLTATLTSDNPAVGLLHTTQPGSPAQTRQVTIVAGTYYSPFSVATGGVAFDPIGAGTTTVSASIPGFIPTTAASQAVAVSGAGIALQGLPVTVGAGLQTNFNPFCCAIAAILGGAEHGGVTVHIESSNPAVALVSPDGTTVGTAAIDIEVPDGQTYVPYYVHGVEGASGTVTLTVSATGFGDATGTVTVTQPALQIINLPASTPSTSANIEFNVYVGLPSSGNVSLFTVMPVRAGHSLTATLTSSAPAVGLLHTTQPGSPAQTRQVIIAADTYYSPFGVAAGGIAFDPVTAGSTTVEATIPGVITTDAGVVIVEVTSGGG